MDTDVTLFRPIPMTDSARTPAALPLAGGPLWFDRVEALERGRPGEVIPAADAPAPVLLHLTSPRAVLAPGRGGGPAIMGILNVTPDSFSDGGRFLDPALALARGQAMVADGADILDIGGESTRPGAAPVPEDEERARTAPVIAALRRGGVAVPVSIDTRKAGVAGAALEEGALIVNDVSALRFDPAMAGVVTRAGVPVVLMHALGDPQTMQDAPAYEDVVPDVYDFLAQAVTDALAAGIARDRIVLDPGIGFGKTMAHNLALLRNLSLFHALGCPLLLGASRKRFIGTLSGEPEAARRMPGSLCVALAGAAQGVQTLRVHDVAETRAALALWRAIHLEEIP